MGSDVWYAGRVCFELYLIDQYVCLWVFLCYAEPFIEPFIHQLLRFLSNLRNDMRLSQA